MNKKSLKIILAYIRVSTDDQDVKKQELEILRYCNENSLKINKTIKVEVSSRKDLIERRIDQMFNDLKDCTTLIVTELSRLGRTMGELLFLIEKLTERGIEIIITKDGVANNLPEHDKKIRRMMYAYFADEERRLISLRTKEALASKKQRGETLGKPKGTIQKSIYDTKLSEIKLLISKQIPLTNIIKLIGIGKPLSLRIYLKKRNLL